MKKILVVEDHAEMRENIAEILELSGYEVATAGNGKQGAAKAQELLPDLIVCDIMMPELDGYGLLYILNKKEETANIPFIFLTAKTDKEDFRKGMSLGADDYLTKPFQELELLNAIEMRLKKFEAQQTLSSPAQAIQQSPSFNELWQKSRSISLSKRDQIFHEGDTCNFVYFVEEGLIKLLKTNRLGKEYITRLHKEQNFLGVEAALENTNYDATAVTMSTAKLKAISTPEFLAAMQDHPNVSSNIVRNLAKGMMDFRSKLLNMAYDSVRKRVAETLLYLHKFFSESERKPASIPLTREEIANMTGTTVETAIRTMSKMKSDGLLAYTEDGIQIIDLEKLASIKN